jgi:hypothetical protein
MDGFWANFGMELALFIFLGVIYYFYQKKKILSYEKNKVPLVMSFILQSCLLERDEHPDPDLDSLIESLDDYLKHQASSPPKALLKLFLKNGKGTEELRNIIAGGLEELDGKE